MASLCREYVALSISNLTQKAHRPAPQLYIW